MTSLLDPRLRPVTFGVTGLVSLLALEYMAVGTAMPTIARDLGGITLYSFAFGATIAFSVIGMILGGWWSDHSGPRAVVLTGCALFGAGLLAAGLAQSMEVFVACRALQGLGGGLVLVSVYVLIAQRVPDDLRPQMFSLLAAAWVLPGLLGPVLTGLLVQHLTWHWVFLCGVPLVVAAVAVLYPSLERTAPADDAPYLQVSTILWAVLAALSVGVLYLGGERITPGEVLVGLPVVALLWLAAWRLLPPGTLTVRRGIPALVGSRAMVGAAILAAESYLPYLLQEEHSYTPTQAGAVLAIASLTWSAGSWVQGRMRTETDRYRVLLTGATVLLVGAFAFLASVALGWPGWTLLVIWGVAIFGVGLAYPNTTLLTMRLSPDVEMGRNSSALQVGEALGSAVSLALAGAVFTRFSQVSSVAGYVAVAVVVVAAALGMTLTATRTRPRVVM